jgi:hypothetical protein
LQDIYFQLALRARHFDEASERMISGLGPSLRSAGGKEVAQRFCDAIEAPGRRNAALIALRRLITTLAPEDVGMVDRRRILLWFTMLGALDDAFDWMNVGLDQFARSGTIGFQWGLLWMSEMRPFREDARFGNVIRRLRFMDYWQRHGPSDRQDFRTGRSFR